MHKQEYRTTYALQSALDRAINGYETALKQNAQSREDTEKWEQFLATERNKIKVVAQIQEGIENYRRTVNKMTVEQREDEKHDSARLGDHMRAEGFAKPNIYWHAHAIISGSDNRAWLLRSIMAECALGIDDGHNGCWLPASSKHTGQMPYPKAVPHSRIHRHNYYAWLNARFTGVRNLGTLISRLRQSRSDLLHATFPPEVMLPKGQWNEPYDNLPPAK